jgi:hypothetical protein
MDLRALALGTYDLNRSAGDYVLFRPVLYEVLGFERWAWGYHFALWQATSIGLHVAVVLSLFVYFRRRLTLVALPQASATPFVLALFFALLFAGTEMVAWHHIAGYLVFCLPLVQGALAYQRLVARPRVRHGAALVVCLGLSCFTYELGNVAALVFAAMLSYAFGRAASAPVIEGRSVVLTSTWALVAAPCVYALWSWLNFESHAYATGDFTPPLVPGRFLLDMVGSAGYWLNAGLWPPAAHLMPGGRIQMAGGFPHWGWLSLFALLACGMTARAAMLVSRRRVRSELALDALPALGFLLLAAAYTAIIVVGRSLQRGLFETLSINSYYDYIFMLLWLLAFFHLVLVPAEVARAKSEPCIRRALLAAIAAVAVMGGVRIFLLHAAMYRDYSGPIGGVIGRIDALKVAHGGEPDFSFELAGDCPAIFDIPWFAHYAHEKRSRYTIADALFPRSARGEDGKYTVACR